MTYRQLLQALRERSGAGSTYGLERMQDLCAALGQPQRSYATWHVAGTNGKGSVAAMLESIARVAGMTTGLNTSPHLNRLRERIRINGQELSQKQMIAAFKKVESARLAAGLEASFFETMTAMAFVHFAQQAVHRAVVEVGLGGRLDATNVLDAEVSAVVSIGLDHTRILGDNLAQIAREKTAIARPGRPVVFGDLPSAALHAALEVAEQIGAQPVLLRDHFTDATEASGPGSATLRWGKQTLTLRPALQGAHQRHNAGVAALVALHSQISPVIVEQGIAQAQWPGRLEIFERAGRRYLFDCAHNLAGAQALGLSLKDGSLAAGLAGDYDLVMATSGGRDSQAFVKTLAQHIGWPKQLRLCRPEGHRLNEPEDLAKQLRSQIPDPNSIQVIRDPLQALEAGDGDRWTLVSGSMYLVGQALALLRGDERDPFETGR